MPDVLLAYAIAALLVAIVFVVAFLIGRAVRSGRFVGSVGFVGLILVAIALLEKAGWSVRPWTHGSAAEAFNDLLFRILFLVGFGLLVIAGTATALNRDES